MKLSYLLVVSAVIYGIFGVLLVVASGPLLALFGEGMGGVYPQLFGAMLIGFAVMNWLVRNALAGEAMRAILVANLVSDAIGGILALIGLLSGVGNGLAWISVIVYLLFALGFGWFLVMGPRGALVNIHE